jgi:hypothetical protein
MYATKRPYKWVPSRRGVYRDYDQRITDLGDDIFAWTRDGAIPTTSKGIGMSLNYYDRVNDHQRQLYEMRVAQWYWASRRAMQYMRFCVFVVIFTPPFFDWFLIPLVVWWLTR